MHFQYETYIILHYRFFATRETPIQCKNMFVTHSASTFVHISKHTLPCKRKICTIRLKMKKKCVREVFAQLTQNLIFKNYFQMQFIRAKHPLIPTVKKSRQVNFLKGKICLVTKSIVKPSPIVVPLFRKHFYQHQFKNSEIVHRKLD